LRGRLAAFKELLAIDSTVIRLANALQKVFPACRTNHTLAAAKLHMVMSGSGASPRRIRITSERAADGKTLKVGAWVQGRLLLFDLGYYSYRLFSRIRQEKGHFISRVKDNADPLIVGAAAADKKPIGMRVREVLRTLRREVLDVEVAVDFKRRAYNGKRCGARERFRLVAVRDEEERSYHVYMTTVQPTILPAHDVARVYTLRWEVELLFKEMKGSYALEDMPSGVEHIAEALMYASMLSLIASRVLLWAVRCRLRLDRRPRLRHLRWGTVLRDYGPLLLNQVLRAAGCRVATAQTLVYTLLTEAVDPNVTRGDLMSRTEASLTA
jgi:IS4 transposase